MGQDLVSVVVPTGLIDPAGEKITVVIRSQQNGSYQPDESL
jgi:hypothetical protein